MTDDRDDQDLERRPRSGTAKAAETSSRYPARIAGMPNIFMHRHPLLAALPASVAARQPCERRYRPGRSGRRSRGPARPHRSVWEWQTVRHNDCPGWSRQWLTRCSLVANVFGVSGIRNRRRRAGCRAHATLSSPVSIRRPGLATPTKLCQRPSQLTNVPDVSANEPIGSSRFGCLLAGTSLASNGVSAMTKFCAASLLSALSAQVMSSGSRPTSNVVSIRLGNDLPAASKPVDPRAAPPAPLWATAPAR